MQKMMGLDYGRKRIGIAISDALGMCAHPRDYINNDSQAFPKILKLAQDENISLLVFGSPIKLSGERSLMQDEIAHFMEKLSAKTDLKLISWDERLTTAQAEKALLEHNVKRSKRKESRDSMAACILLQSYLDAQKNTPFL